MRRSKSSKQPELADLFCGTIIASGDNRITVELPSGAQYQVDIPNGSVTLLLSAKEAIGGKLKRLEELLDVPRNSKNCGEFLDLNPSPEVAHASGEASLILGSLTHAQSTEFLIRLWANQNNAKKAKVLYKWLYSPVVERQFHADGVIAAALPLEERKLVFGERSSMLDPWRIEYSQPRVQFLKRTLGEKKFMLAVRRAARHLYPQIQHASASAG